MNEKISFDYCNKDDMRFRSTNSFKNSKKHSMTCMSPNADARFKLNMQQFKSVKTAFANSVDDLFIYYNILNKSLEFADFKDGKYNIQLTFNRFKLIIGDKFYVYFPIRWLANIKLDKQYYFTLDNDRRLFIDTPFNAYLLYVNY